jgi:hypothetical protein
MKKLIAGVIAVAALWSIWPYYALFDLANSINKADPTGLERRIEWSSVRQGLSEDLNTFLIRNIAQQINGRGLPGAALGAGLAAAIGPVIVKKTVDAFATPQTIAALIAQGKTSASSIETVGSGAPKASNQEALHLSKLKYAFFSHDPFTFKVEVAPSAQTNDATLTLLFKWNGDWRLTRISASRKTLEAMARNEQSHLPPASIGSEWLSYRR